MFMPPSGGPAEACAPGVRAEAATGAATTSDTSRHARRASAAAVRRLARGIAPRIGERARPGRRRPPRRRAASIVRAMPPFWIWTQIAIVIVVLIGMVVAITKLA